MRKLLSLFAVVLFAASPAGLLGQTKSTEATLTIHVNVVPVVQKTPAASTTAQQSFITLPTETAIEKTVQSSDCTAGLRPQGAAQSCELHQTTTYVIK